MTPKWPLSGGHVCAHIPISFCPSPMKIHQGMWIHWPIIMIMHILTIWDQWPQMTPRWPLTLVLLGRMCAPTPISFCPSAMKIHTVCGNGVILLGLTYFSTIHTHTHHTTLRSPFFLRAGTIKKGQILWSPSPFPYSSNILIHGVTVLPILSFASWSFVSSGKNHFVLLSYCRNGR